MFSTVYLFHSLNNSRFCGAVFSEIAIAEKWILKHKLTGLLTEYPVDNGVYDWAIEKHLLTVKKDKESSPEFIGGFSTASQQHFHYEDGIRQ